MALNPKSLPTSFSRETMGVLIIFFLSLAQINFQQKSRDLAKVLQGPVAN